ncbi:MAG: PAS domain S-box protein, partial [Verrucomicrobiota bacterium]
MAASLRERAEKHFREQEELSPEKPDSLSPESMRTILHELRVHQIELEMQNDELLAAQADLDASRERYFDLYDLAPAGYCTLSEQGLILEANLTAATLLDMNRGALVNQPVTRFIHKEDQDTFYQRRQQLMKTREAQQCELRMVKQDGSTFWAHLQAAAARDEEGAPAYRIVLSDVSGRKAAQEKIRASEERYAQTLEAVNDGLWDWDIPTGNAFFSSHYYSLLGYDDGEFPASYPSWRTLVHPDDLDRVEADLQGSIETGTSFTIDLRMKLKSGKWGWVSTRGKVTERDAQGNVLRMMGTLSDIAGRKRAEEQMLNLRTAVEQSGNMIVITDIRGNIEYVNPAFEKTTGYSAAEAAGKNPRILKSDEQDADFYRHLWATITAGNIWRGEFHNTRKDGSLYWEAATISPVQNDKGETVRYLAIKEDITGRKAIEASLATALQRAEAANRAKSEFLNVMSHELRTPLNGVLGFAQLLSDTPLDDEQKSFAKTISSSGEHLLAIISDILDFSSIDAGALALHAAPLAVADLVRTAEDTVRKAAAEKGIELRSELAAGVPEQIAGDELRIRQILINLLGNAVKFTASGSVVLRV